MDETLKLLGFIYRAKKLVLGEEVLNRIGDVKLIIIAKDISDKSKERFMKKIAYYDIPYLDCYKGEEISKSLGKNNVKVVGIIDEGFKNTLLKKKR